MRHSSMAWLMVVGGLCLSWLTLAQVNSVNTANLASLNLVVNPSFEANFESWVGVATRSDEDARDGVFSAEVQQLSQSLTLPVGAYEVRAWGLVRGAAKGELRFAGVRLQWTQTGFREQMARVNISQDSQLLEVFGENGFLLDFVQVYRVSALEALHGGGTMTDNNLGSVARTTAAYRRGRGLPSGSAELANPTTRDARQWMFAANSIWNTPIGSNAVFVPSGLLPEKHFAFDQDLFFESLAAAPWRNLHPPGNWGQGRCTGASNSNLFGQIQLADDVLIADATQTPYQTPNNASGILQTDGHTLVQLEPMTRCEKGSSTVFGYRATDQDMYGNGLWGGHFGSGLSSLGGTIRHGELLGEHPIRHVLKLKVWGAKYLTFDRTASSHPLNGPGFRFPAIRADFGAGNANQFNAYGVLEPSKSNPIKSMVMGSLLAIPPSQTLESLGIDPKLRLFPVIQKIFVALQNYGAYIDDNTGWEAHYLGAEYGVQEELIAIYGQGLEDNPEVLTAMNKLITALQVVDNNTPFNLGGGGATRVPRAPAFYPAAPELKQKSLNRSFWKFDAFNTRNGSSTRFITDGKADTAWRSGRGQGAFQDIIIDLGKTESFHKIKLISGEFNSKTYHSWGRDLLIETSSDRKNWRVVAGSAGAPILELRFKPVLARFVRITQTNRNDPGVEWAISDLQLLESP
jgi:hypothetical protein